MKKTNSSSRLKVIIGIGLVLGLGGGGYLLMRKKQDKLQPTYQTIPVTRQLMRQTILSTGIVQPENRLEIKPPVAGRVESVLAAEGQIVKKGQILAWLSSTERAALLDAARAKGQAELKRWEELYRPTPIIAPIDGTIILRNVEAGQTFSAVDSVFSMSNRLTIKAQVDETDLAQIKREQKAVVVLDAYSKQAIDAQVEKLAYDAKTVNNVTTYTVDVLPLATPDFMRSGMTANVTFLISEKPDAIVVPSEALLYKQGQANVLIANSEVGKKPEERAVTLGLSDGKYTEIVSGLSESESVLITDQPLISGKSASGSPFSPFGGPSKKKEGR